MAKHHGMMFARDKFYNLTNFVSLLVKRLSFYSFVVWMRTEVSGDFLLDGGESLSCRFS